MAADIEQRAHVGFRGRASFPIHQNQSSIPFDQNNHPSHHVNQLQFNLHTPYSINSLASNFTKPQPLVIEKVPGTTRVVSDVPAIPHVHGDSVPSSPVSSISSDRLHFAVQLAKMDAKKMKEREEMECYYQENHPVQKSETVQNIKTTQVYGPRKLQELRKQPGKQSDKMPLHKLHRKGRKDREIKRNLHDREYRFYPGSESYPEKDTNAYDKQTREIRRLEKQINKYLEKLDELIHKGQEVIQKKDKRFRRNHRDNISHLSDDDTDPRQFERAEEQATRSARVLYMIERQIRELDNELRRKGRDVGQAKKNQTLSRLAAAQRATVRALQMLINSAPLQPKGSRHYPSVYQELTSLIQQLSLLSMQLEGGGGAASPEKKPQNENGNNFSKKPYQNQKSHIKVEVKSGSLKDKTRFSGQTAFTHQSVKDPMNTSSLKEPQPDVSALSIEPTPERSATLKAGLEALLRMKALEQRPTNQAPPPVPMNSKKKAVLLPPSLQAKRRKAHLAVQKSIKQQPVETANFTKETTASRLKKVERQKTCVKDGIREFEKGDGGGTEVKKSLATSPRTVPGKCVELDGKLREKEIQRQVWLEDEAKRKLTEVMEIPKHLISEAEVAIKMKLKPLLDQAQAVVDSSKTKRVQERFADLASNVTMKESETLSEMILDDLLMDTVEEFQRLENDGEAEADAVLLQESPTLENILQRLEQFEKEEESIRRHLNPLSYSDPADTNPKLRRSEKYESLDIKESSVEKRTREPCPIVIESTTMENSEPPVENKARRENLKFTRGETANPPAQVTTVDSNVKHKRTHAQISTLTKALEKPPISIFLPSKIRENIFSYQEKYSRYLEETNAGHHGTFNPWKVVERLSDEIFEEIIEEVAVEFCGACDDVTELIFKSEFMKE